MVYNGLLRGCAVAVGLLCGCSSTPVENESIETTGQAVQSTGNVYGTLGALTPDCRWIQNVGSYTGVFKPTRLLCNYTANATAAANVNRCKAYRGNNAACNAQPGCIAAYQSSQKTPTDATPFLDCMWSDAAHCVALPHDQCQQDGICTWNLSTNKCRAIGTSFGASPSVNGPVSNTCAGRDLNECKNIIDKYPMGFHGINAGRLCGIYNNACTNTTSFGYGMTTTATPSCTSAVCPSALPSSACWWSFPYGWCCSGWPGC